MPGTLFVVATPLGNLQDVTLRALDVLRAVAVIAAEDTRQSRKLLSHFGISTPLVSYHDHVERQRAPRLVERLRRGEDVALISDAGTPGIADPGYRLVCAAIEAGLRIVPIPGPSAVVAVISAAGLPADRFCFEGFVPARRSERRSFYLGLRSERRTIVCFETARRLAASLADLEQALGARRIVVARELTKTFEEFLRGPVGEVRKRADEGVRGEVTLVIEPAGEPELASEANVREAVARLRARGMGLKETARAVARDSGWAVRDVYRLGLENEAREGGEPGLS